MAEGIIIDLNGDPDRIRLFHLTQCFYALRLQERTGLRHSRGSVLNLVRENYGVKSRTLTGAVDELAEIIREITGDYPKGYKR